MTGDARPEGTPNDTPRRLGAAADGRVSATGAVLTRTAAPCGRPRVLPQLVIAALCGAYAVGAAIGWGTPSLALFMGDFGLAGAALAACLSCLWYARSVSGGRLAWLLFAASSATVCAGNAIWGWYEVVLARPVPRASAADFCFLLFAPFAIVGLLVLATRPASRAGWLCLALDACLIAGSLLTITWSLALARAAHFDGRSTARIALSLAYPVLDIVLISMVLALHFRRSSAHRAAVNTAIAALAVTVLCDALFTSPLLREHYHSGQLLDAGWFAGSMLLAYAPWVGGRDAAPQAAVEAPPAARGSGPDLKAVGSLSALTPYLAAAICTLGILYNVLNGRKIDRVVLFTGCVVALMLVARQGIMLAENIALTRKLAEQENHFRSLVQGSSDVIMIAERSGVLRYVSPAARGVYGRDAAEMEGTELAAHIHPEDLGRVLHEVRRFLAAVPAEEPATRIECRIRSGDGGWLNVESSINRYEDGLIFNSRDVTERVRLQAQLQHNASHDPLTDLPNRALFTERVGQALGGRRAADGEAAVLFIDLDGFKSVNDTAGHQAGDELLVQAARRLQDSVRAGDTAARLGGDEFAALICGTGERQVREQRIREIADRLRGTLSEPYTVGGTTQVRVAASIGVAFAEPGISPAELMRNADLAMYRAKSTGKNRVELYAPQMQAEVMRRAELAARLRTALRQGEFTLLHQPVVDLRTGEVQGVQAYPRWRSAQGVLCPPAEFLRLAEQPGDEGDRSGTADGGRSGQPAEEPGRGARPGGAGGGEAAEISRWLLDEAIARAARRRRAGITVPVAVRLPVRRLMGRELPSRNLETLLNRHELPPGALVLELSALDPRVPLEELERRIEALRRMGVRIALEGVCGGYAGLVALHRLPVDIIKLDRTLTDELVASARLHKITAGVLRIAADLGVHSVAEGVDRPEQVMILRELGCTHGQGTVFCPPLDETRLRGALARGDFPVPHRQERARAVLASPASLPAPLPVRRRGATAPDPLG